MKNSLTVVALGAVSLPTHMVQAAGKMNQYQIDETLYWHNKARSEIAQAGLCANMLEMTWNADVARAAETNDCPSTHNGKAKDAFGSHVGENLAWGSNTCKNDGLCDSGGICGSGTTPECDDCAGYGVYCTIMNSIYDRWYQEETQDASSTTDTCLTYSQGGGHCTQVVWQNSYGVGCTYQKDCGKWGTTVACNYYPPGNYNGGHIGDCSMGPACNACPNSHPHCTTGVNAGLCSASASASAPTTSPTNAPTPVPIATDPCTNLDCGAHGLCNSDNGECGCTGGWSGLLCQVGPNSCFDGEMNGSETDLDCGGVDCPICVLYRWAASDWGSCSVPCGTGTRTRSVQCEVTANLGVEVDNEFCEDLHPVNLEEPCNVFECAVYTWMAGGWSECSAECGSGNQQRSLSCKSSIGDLLVFEKYCAPATEPETSQVCNEDLCTGPHLTAEWAACSEPCGSGVQVAVVSCLNAKEQTLSIEECGEPPAALRFCNEQPCPVEPGQGARWVMCPWDECTAVCGGASGSMSGEQHREVFCQDNGGNTIDETLCTAIKPTTDISGCNSFQCTAPNWMTDKWSPCNLTTNQRYRGAHCHAINGANAGDDLCEAGAGAKPVVEQACVPSQCRVVADSGLNNDELSYTTTVTAGVQWAIGTATVGLLVVLAQ